MIRIHIEGKTPEEAILEVLRAVYIEGQSVQVVAGTISAAHAIACGADALAATARQTVFDQWMDSRSQEDTANFAALAVGLVPTPRRTEPVYLVRHIEPDVGALRVAKAGRKAARPRWRR